MPVPIAKTFGLLTLVTKLKEYFTLLLMRYTTTIYLRQTNIGR